MQRSLRFRLAFNNSLARERLTAKFQPPYERMAKHGSKALDFEVDYPNNYCYWNLGHGNKEQG
ncbi:hypothetical protein QC761_0050830 [Podospora bellae-mahoneyi]|uniref:Uncharacterized protein n=1 Tax=Podospora bellae-mahoneyi TaxID=2093777 RepID=A0ABR0FMK3_9PEZI|nr:hypothetical protein QC761_0050830 [Podospora bellae-mahoneyi]